MKPMNEIHKLENSERQPCEVWTRVMGYHRPVSQFNRGKKQEHAERVFFREEPRVPCTSNLAINKSAA
jgi:hypothetical protein